MQQTAARGIVIKNNKVLLIHRLNHGSEYYTIPGGSVEPGETPENAVLRELREETSLDITVSNLLGKFEDKKRNLIQHVFICGYLNGKPELGESGEKESMAKDPQDFYEPMWIPLEKVSDLKIQPSPTEQAFKLYIINQQKRSIMKDFISFVREQGVVGLAVGFILGGAIAKVVSSLVNDLINPLLGLLLGAVGPLKEAYWQIGTAKIMWGSFVGVSIDFIVIALVVYFGVKILKLDKIDKKKD